MKSTRESNAKPLKVEEVVRDFGHALTQNYLNVLVECCVLSLTNRGHLSGVHLLAHDYENNLLQENIAVTWTTEVNKQMLNTWTDENRTADHGAMCLALHITKKILGHNNVYNSQLGEGVDYWVMDPETFDYIARIEVSGIRQETTKNSIKTRIKVKIEQTKQSDYTMVPAYVSVVEFSKPATVFLKK